MFSKASAVLFEADAVSEQGQASHVPQRCRESAMCLSSAAFGLKMSTPVTGLGGDEVALGSVIQ